MDCANLNVDACATVRADDMIKLDKQEEEDPRARRGMGGMPGM